MKSDSSDGALWQFTNVGKVSFSMQAKKFINNLTYKLSDDFALSKLNEDIYSDAYFTYNFPMNLMKVTIPNSDSPWTYLIIRPKILIRVSLL